MSANASITYTASLTTPHAQFEVESQPPPPFVCTPYNLNRTPPPEEIASCRRPIQDGGILKVRAALKTAGLKVRAGRNR